MSAPMIHESPDLEHAARELRVARAILLDPTCDDTLAAGHLARAWEGVAEATCAGPIEPAAPVSAATWLGPAAQARMSARARAEVDRILPEILAQRARPPAARERWAPTRTALLDHVDALLRLIEGPPRPLRGSARRLLKLLAVGVTLVALLVVALRPWRGAGSGPWVGTYYNRPDFTGAAVTRHDPDVRFDWGAGAPMDEVPADRFSVRWEACFTLKVGRAVTFQLISDDGARLSIDDAVVIDNWGNHATQSRGKDHELAAGVHRLRVEYFEHQGDASVTLVASLDGEVPRRIPRSMLSPPTADGGCAE